MRPSVRLTTEGAQVLPTTGYVLQVGTVLAEKPGSSLYAGGRFASLLVRDKELALRLAHGSSSSGQRLGGTSGKLSFTPQFQPSNRKLLQNQRRLTVTASSKAKRVVLGRRASSRPRRSDDMSDCY